MSAGDSKFFKAIKCWINWDKLYEYFIRVKGLKDEKKLCSTNSKQLLYAQNFVAAGNMFRYSKESG